MNKTRFATTSLIGLLTAFLFFSHTALAQVPDYVPTDGLVGYWPFNGNANDASGNGNNGTVNGATLTSDRFGAANSAYSFDGNSSLISLAQSFFNQNTSVTSLTYSTWIKITNLPIAGTEFALSNKEGFWRTIGLAINSNGSITFGGSQPSPQGYFGIYSPANSVILGEWQLICLTFNNGVLNIYLNGNLIATANTTYTSLNYSYLQAGNSTSTNYLGAAHPVSPGITNFFNGQIDDFGIWNRALTPQEITALYNGGSPQLTTSAITNKTTSSATSGGNVTAEGSSAVTARGVVWSTSANPTIALTTKTSDGTGIGSFTSQLTGLSHSTTYYVRAYATNAEGTFYGNEVTFTTTGECLPPYVPTDGLVGYWPFCGNANDESGNGNNGTVNGATLTNDRFGNANSSYHFDGNSDYIFVNRSFFNNGAQQFTLQAWCNLELLSNPNNGNSSHMLFNTSPHVGFAQSLNWGGANKYSFFLGNGTPATSWNVFFNESSSQNVQINAWRHVVFIKDNNLYKLYINGVLDATWITPQVILPYFYKMYIGSTDPSASNEVFFGVIDDAGYWNRALTQEEIYSLYNGCTQPSWVNAPADVTLSCVQAIDLNPSELGYDNGEIGPCAVSGSVEGVITGTSDQCNGGTLTQTWTYTEGQTTISHTQKITIEPAAEIAWLETPADITVDCNERIFYTSPSISYSNGGEGVCENSGEVEPTVTSSFTPCEGGTITELWEVTKCGTTLTHSRVVTVLPIPAPEWVNPPVDTTVACKNVAMILPSSIPYDNMGPGLCKISGPRTSTIDANTFACGQTYKETWTITDACNRTITHDRNIQVLTVDTDDDGAVDLTDNCPDYPNPNQIDLNNNGIGDACETGNKFGVNTTQPLSELHVSNGSVYLDNPDKGIILKGADGKCYKITVDNGALKLLVVPCPQSN